MNDQERNTLYLAKRKEVDDYLKKKAISDMNQTEWEKLQSLLVERYRFSQAYRNFEKSPQWG